MTSTNESDYHKQWTALWYEGRALEKREKAADTITERRTCQLAQRALWAQERDLMHVAAEAFAQLNGWRYTADKMFSASTLARGGVHANQQEWLHRYEYDTELYDHPLYFRELARPYRAAAIVGQPYDTTPETARVGAAKLGLKCHVPANHLASWHYPGQTRFFVFTRPEIERVQFLPEQMKN